MISVPNLATTTTLLSVFFLFPITSISLILPPHIQEQFSQENLDAMFELAAAPPGGRARVCRQQIRLYASYFRMGQLFVDTL